MASFRQAHSTSVTEQEFDEAVRLGLPVFGYVLDPTASWPDEYVEDAASQQMAVLLQKVNRFVRSTFTTPDSLAAAVAADLERLRFVGVFDLARLSHWRSRDGPECDIGCCRAR
jgi:hypothetical protein